MKGGGPMKGTLLRLLLSAVAAAALQGAEPIPLRLDVTGKPEGAKVFVDGTLHGTLHGESPCNVTLTEPGLHLLHVEAPSYRPFDECVRLDKSNPVMSKTERMTTRPVKISPKTTERIRSRE